MMDTHPETAIAGSGHISSQFTQCHLLCGLRTAALLLLALACGACAVQTPRHVDVHTADWKKNRENLQEIHSWDLSARIAVQLEQDSGSASLKWRQRKEAYLIRIIGPLGRGSLELEGDAHGVTMRNGNNQEQKAGDPGMLMQDNLGWQVPLSGLVHWIKGIPNPHGEVQTLILDQNARLSELTQAGWHITYKRYQQSGNLRLPTKIEIQNQKLKLKLVINKWTLSP